MGSAAVKPSPAVSHLLRSRRLEMNLTLREVSEKLAERGERFPESTLVRVELGKLDPGVRRLHLLLSLYQIPPHLVADLVELEEHAVEAPEGTDLDALLRKGVEFLKQGNTGQALAHIFAIKRQESDNPKSRALRQDATLAIASAARDLGKLHLARQLVEDVLCDSRTILSWSGLWFWRPGSGGRRARRRLPSLSSGKQQRN